MGLAVLWRFLIYVAFAVGASLAASRVFYLQPLELLLIFVCALAMAWILHLMWAVIGMGIRSIFFGRGSIVTRSIVLMAIGLIAFLAGSHLFGTIDRHCRSDEWPHWYCL